MLEYNINVEPDEKKHLHLIILEQMRPHSVNKEYHGEHVKNENKHYFDM